MSNILDFWPISSPPRPNQIKALEWMVEQKTKYIILQAPVGSGKSLIGLTYTRWASQGNGNSYILTPQKILQEQYETTYLREPDKSNHIVSLYGKSNYSCNQKNTTCDIGSLIKPRCDRCPFGAAVTRAKMAPNVVLNYKLALLMFGYTTVFNSRTTMILDECHTLEEHLTEFDAVTINQHRTEKFGIKWQTKTTLAQAIKWVDEIYAPAAQKYLNKMFDDEVEALLDKDGMDLTPKETKTLREYTKLEEHIDEVTMLLLISTNELETGHVLVHDKETMKFKQLYGSKNFHKMLAPMANNVVMMSSTILNYKGFCADLGISPNDVSFLSIDSDFPKENRPVVYIPQMKMNASWSKPENSKDRAQMKDTILKLLEMHGTEKGIIHTANFQVAKWIIDELEHAAPQQLLHHNPESGDDRNAVINQYITTPKPCVLVSPSITEGLDLKEDLGRFAIIVKVPFGFLGDQWIKRRLELSQEWYQRRALIDIIQGGGRVVRSRDDKGTVYILDASFNYLFNQTKHLIPQWWLDGFDRI